MAGRPTKFTQALADTNSGIYALTISGVVYYIGQAKNINKRYKQHCSLAQNRGYTKRNVWLYEILKSGGLPDLIVIEHTDDLDAREIYWIGHYRKQGLAQMNTSGGGHSYDYAEHCKLNNPWGKGWSPIRRRLNVIHNTIQSHRRRGELHQVQRLETKLRLVNDAIKRVGLKEMNMILWERYGKA